MPGPAAEMARRLARDAEAVCRHYLSNGRRQGNYWTVGDVDNTHGRSLYVRLIGPEYGRGAAGAWTDAATGQNGDLLDLIAVARNIKNLRDTLTEARRFLALPPFDPPLNTTRRGARSRSPAETSEAARRLFRAGRPVPGSPAEDYLRARGITAVLDAPSLRFHADVWYRENEGAPRQSWPALLAGVGDPKGAITGIQRTWLDRNRPAKAPVSTPRKALGRLLGNAVWIGVDCGATPDVLAAGEGLETMLALRSVLPAMPMAATLSAPCLAALILDPPPARLYIARDNDAAGLRAAKGLRMRTEPHGVEVIDLSPKLDDWNGDLSAFGRAGVLTRLAGQLAPGDLDHFAPGAGKLLLSPHAL